MTLIAEVGRREQEREQGEVVDKHQRAHNDVDLVMIEESSDYDVSEPPKDHTACPDRV